MTPYSIALAEFLLTDPLSFQLPRKFKIAFSGCSDDCSGATINDVGFIARKRGKELGFAVYTGGGMGAKSRVAELLEEFVPDSDIHFTAEAVKRVFDKHGNRKNKNKARLRFLIGQIGFERFKELYKAELSELRQDGFPTLQVREIQKNDHPTYCCQKLFPKNRKVRQHYYLSFPLSQQTPHTLIRLKNKITILQMILALIL